MHRNKYIVVASKGHCIIIIPFETQTSSIRPVVVESYLLLNYSKTSLNRTLLFQKVVRFSKISVYTKCRIAPANRTKFGLGDPFRMCRIAPANRAKFRLARWQSNAATRQNEHVNQTWRHASCKQIRTLFG